MRVCRPLQRLAGLGCGRRTPLVASCGLQTDAQPSHSPTVEDLLSEGRAANLATWPAAKSAVRYHGSGMHMGIPGKWSLTFRPDGAFYSEFRSKHLDILSGHDGGLGSKCWEVDGMGVPRHLDLDDNEHRLLATHVELGLWLRPEASSRMQFSLDEAAKVQRSPENQHEPGSEASTSDGSAEQRQPAVNVRYSSHRVDAMIHLVEGGWLPERMTIKVYGKDEVSYYHNWKKHESCHWFPTTIHQHTSGGSQNTIEVLGASVMTSWEGSLFSLPPAQLRPPDTTFDPPEGGSIPAWWTDSGHLLVRPRIDGRELGYMILDTGASGFCIDKKAADSVDMVRFGEYQLSGMLVQFGSCMRRSRTFQLGPMTIQEPMYMEMEVHGLVKDPPGRVIGIVGYDVFRRCVMRIPGSDTMQGTVQIRLEDPSVSEGLSGEGNLRTPAQDPRWQHMDFVSSLPIVQARISTGSHEHEVRFMIDSGAGGVDLMFNERATGRLKLMDAVATSRRMLRGVGDNDRHSVKSGVLPWMLINDVRHEKLSALFLGNNGLDLSLYVDGIICSPILARSSTVLDFARKRIMFLQNDHDGRRP